MEYAFTHYARKRCKEQNINLHNLLKEVKTIPAPRGNTRWISTEGHTIMLSGKANGNIVIVTVIAKHKYRQTMNKLHKGRNTF
ncbi:hypothetical protein [Paenibacillus popilliae]|uniref:Protein-disulfide isomerase n=2 Tax=Paenibacillus popilliae ATCC 14706 TaxID=1212764 RepID=M9LRI0_PAEPP|nr:hypothetical protein [Paenibacillus popilliae]GAC44011.1 protein-disulfide isomerase [Paenibacillus popilliae ATCC 14706]